ncbi:HWE histidine kinase domain-containing protein [Tenacibaculum geojense]|uniref:histidine kinase n=1 Tax=Tenacibaculum geojense TaxID=915352 RepID=A0ABW3JS68_9FLAO
MNNETSKLNLEKQAIDNCEKQVINDVGYIQPFGYLFGITPNNFVITHVSDNCSEWCNSPVEAILGKKLNSFFSEEFIHQCNNTLAHSTIKIQREYVGRIEANNLKCDAFVHIKNNRLILELQKTNSNQETGIKSLDYVQHVLYRISSHQKIQSLLEHVVEELRAISGFDRVKAYKFLSDGAGEVIAESKSPLIESYLGLRFPAFDIPQAARKLYTQTPIRIIPAVAADQIKIHTLDDNQKPLDLSLAIFRGVVPVHAMYLSNMNIKGSLSIPIVINGKMWGLFAFHHLKEKMLDSEILTTLEILGRSISLMLGAILQKQQLAITQESSRIVSSLFISDDSVLGFKSYWESVGPELATLLECDGVALLGNNSYDTYGTCLGKNSAIKLATYINNDFTINKDTTTPIAINSIASNYPDLQIDEIAGVFAIPVPVKSYQYVFYFRKQIEKQVQWAGNPTKKIEKTEDGFRLNPRASFSEYVSSKHQQSDPFDDFDFSIGVALGEALTKIMSSINIQNEHRERLGLVIRELNHRVRNTLALVSSIVSQSQYKAHSIESYIITLKQRILALSETQKLLTEQNWKPINIRTFFDRSLVSYREYIGSRILLKGKEYALPANLASLFSLIIHELASNSSKYGALSNSNGFIKIEWKFKNENLSIHWKETDGPIVKKPSRFGFGYTLITEALPYEFKGTSDIKFLPKGIEAFFKIPIATSEILLNKNNTNNDDSLNTGLQNFKALILEDDYIIAKETTALLKQLGAKEVDTIPAIETAINCINTKWYDIAILDANIRGEFSGKVADLLHQKKIPFVFATGYGSKDQNLKSYHSIAILTKPVSKAKLANAIKNINQNIT